MGFELSIYHINKLIMQHTMSLSLDHELCHQSIFNVNMTINTNYAMEKVIENPSLLLSTFYNRLKILVSFSQIFLFFCRLLLSTEE